MGDGSGAVSVLTEDASMLLSPEGGQGLRPVAAAPKGAFARKDGTEWAVAAAAVSFTLGEAGRPSTGEREGGTGR